MNSAIAFIESNTSGTGELFLRKARAIGLIPILLARDPARYPFAAPLAEFITVDTSNHVAMEIALSTVDSRHQIAAVFSSSEYFIEAASRLASERGLPCPDAAAVARCRDKGSQRQVLARYGVRSPRWRTISTPDEAQEFVRALDTAVVVKPRTGSGSVGVRLAAGPSDAALAAAALLGLSSTECSVDAQRSVLIEEYIDGPQFSVEMFDGQVVGVTRNFIGTPPTFVEIGHVFPADIPADDAQSISRLALQAASSLGLSFGALHIEIRTGPFGPAIIEVNPRLAGGMIPALVHNACGVDMLDAVLRRALGQAIRIDATPTHRSAIRFVIPERAGTIVGFSGLDAAQATDGVVEVSVRTSLPTDYRVHGDFRDRVGHVITSVPLPGDPLVYAARALAFVAARYAPSNAVRETPHV